ncbi:sigma-54 dependent transcriptional regulator [Rhodoferax sp.]|uniref:sigma-54-dependent transcriptional regulator n=1 Tax=Rhodoferax sp. TaxID=50421 RepID=UPI0026217961|nr:sigma-54 dependent transcriptional regulator [Rhodoferax sp.]
MHPSPLFAPATGSDNPVQAWPDWSILIVDDEPGMRNFLVKTLVPRCHTVHAVGSAEEGAQVLQLQHVDLIVLDISLPGQSGVAWLKTLRGQGYRGYVILITAFADLETAIEALRAGASDFILKPFRVPQILNAIKHCFDCARLLRENYVLKHTLSRQSDTHTGLIGRSAFMQGLRAALPRVAQVESTVLLQGESGTGKELVARTLHQLSPRHAGPFVPVNCASLSDEQIEVTLFGQATASHLTERDGLFYYAQGGTLFLDEVADLPLPMQAALLRALEDLQIRPVGSNQLIQVNVRIMAATNRVLQDEVAAGRFRKDLYFRLQVVEMHLLPLRDRKQDIADLAAHFMAQLVPRLGLKPLTLSPEHMAYLMQYPWPGNARELRNLIERSLILGELNVSALYDMSAPCAPSSSPAPTDLHTLEKQHIQAVLDSVQGDKTRAAELLGISRRTLERRSAEWATP